MTDAQFATLISTLFLVVAMKDSKWFLIILAGLWFGVLILHRVMS